MNRPTYIGDLVRWKAIKELLPEGDGLCLDAGCGCSEYADLVREKGYTYVGLDIEKRAADVIIGSVEDLPSEIKEKKFKAIIFVDVLEHLKDPEKAVLELKNVLDPDGFIVFHTPNKDQTHVLLQPIEQEDHVRKGFDEAELLELFKDFRKVNLYKTFDPIDCTAWELVYAINNQKRINPYDLIDFDWKSYNNLGWVGIAKYPKV